MTEYSTWSIIFFVFLIKTEELFLLGEKCEENHKGKIYWILRYWWYQYFSWFLFYLPFIWKNLFSQFFFYSIFSKFSLKFFQKKILMMIMDAKPDLSKMNFGSVVLIQNWTHHHFWKNLTWPSVFFHSQFFKAKFHLKISSNGF